MTDPQHNSPLLLKQSETNRMIKRIFVVAEILARGQTNLERDCTTLEKCSENQATVDLQYLEYESNSETQ
jgi:hypothetical protein